MQIRLLGKRVAVEKLKKQSAKQTDFLVMPESEQYLGIIKYVGADVSPKLEVGNKVYFGTTFQNFRMDGSEVCVMEEDNVLAVVDETV